MPTALRAEIRMGEEEIDLLDQANALLELEHIVARVRAMADVNYDMNVEEVWEYLDIWAAGGNAEAKHLLVALKGAVGRALPASGKDLSAKDPALPGLEAHRRPPRTTPTPI